MYWDLFFCHCDQTLLRLINDWAEKHPKEILILALSHFKGFDKKIKKNLHTHLLNFIKTLFGARLFHKRVKYAEWKNNNNNKKHLLSTFNSVSTGHSYPEELLGSRQKRHSFVWLSVQSIPWDMGYNKVLLWQQHGPHTGGIQTSSVLGKNKTFSRWGLVSTLNICAHLLMVWKIQKLIVKVKICHKL